MNNFKELLLAIQNTLFYAIASIFFGVFWIVAFVVNHVWAQIALMFGVIYYVVNVVCQ